MKNGDFKDQVKEQPGSASVVQGISEDRYGIGYSGIGYSTSGVNMVPLAAKAGQPFVEPTHPIRRTEAIRSGATCTSTNQAPVNRSPHRERISGVRLQQRRAIDVLRDGYFPVLGALAEKQLAKIR